MISINSASGEALDPSVSAALPKVTTAPPVSINSASGEALDLKFSVQEVSIVMVSINSASGEALDLTVATALSSGSTTVVFPLIPLPEKRWTTPAPINGAYSVSVSINSASGEALDVFCGAS